MKGTTIALFVAMTASVVLTGCAHQITEIKTKHEASAADDLIRLDDEFRFSASFRTFKPRGALRERLAAGLDDVELALNSRVDPSGQRVWYLCVYNIEYDARQWIVALVQAEPGLLWVKWDERKTATHDSTCEALATHAGYAHARRY